MNCNGHMTNMLSFNKVKLHGMTSSKWTTKDKLTQYKGIINLYRRDRKIIEADSQIYRKRLKRELYDLQRNVEKDRLALDNAIGGGKQNLRHALAEHKELQLAFQNTHPEKVVENMEQLIFTKRKQLDKLAYQNDMKAKKLVDLKLEQADMKDRLKIKTYNQYRLEKDSRVLAGKVQDAFLKKEAALAIKHIYIAILDIMKKDALYYDSIITTLECDYYRQSRCILGATKLGQLATEYVDDRRQDYDTLQNVVIQDILVRRHDLKRVGEQVKKASSNIKFLLRKDSDITNCRVKLPISLSMNSLRKEITDIEKTLISLKNVTRVPTYEAIYPCLEEQQKQRKRLHTMLRRCQRDKEILLNKLNHAELMNSVLKSTNIDLTGEYDRRKGEITTETDSLNAKTKKNEVMLKFRHDIAANVGIALRHLLQLSCSIKSNNDGRRKTSASVGPVVFWDADIKEPQEMETDAREILPILMGRLKSLMANFAQKSNDSRLIIDDAFKTYEGMMVDQMVQSPLQINNKMSAASMMEDFALETCLTREEIKKQSAEIVSANAINQDLVPLFVPKKIVSRIKTR